MTGKIHDSSVLSTKIRFNMLQCFVLLHYTGCLLPAVADQPKTANFNIANRPVIRDFRAPPPGGIIPPEQQKKMREQYKKEHPGPAGPEGEDATFVTGVTAAGTVLTLEEFRTYVRKIGRDRFVKEWPEFRSYIDQRPPKTWTSSNACFPNGKPRELLIIESYNVDQMQEMSGLEPHAAHSDKRR